MGRYHLLGPVFASLVYPGSTLDFAEHGWGLGLMPSLKPSDFVLGCPSEL